MSTNEILDDYARYKNVVDNIRDVIWEVDTNAVFTLISPAIKEMVGYEAGEMIGRSILEFLTDESRTFLISQLSKAAPVETGNAGHSLLYDVEFVCKDRRVIWCEVSVKPIYRDKKLICYIGTTRDASEKKMYEIRLQDMLENLKRVNEQLEDTVTYDMLTGAYNIRKFEYYVGREIEKSDTYGETFSIIIFDIDNFKRINDVNGHNKGDRVLQDIAALIKCTLRATDKLFRWGGDEFIVLLPDLNQQNAFIVSKKIRETIQANNFEIEGNKVTVSLGVGAYAHRETSDQFVTRVDGALLRAKNNGKNSVEQG